MAVDQIFITGQDVLKGTDELKCDPGTTKSVRGKFAVESAAACRGDYLQQHHMDRPLTLADACKREMQEAGCGNETNVGCGS